MNGNSMIDFLFPERQIGAIRKKHGWIYRPGKGQADSTNGSTLNESSQAATNVNHETAMPQPVNTPSVARSSIATGVTGQAAQTQVPTASIPSYVPPSRRAGLRSSSQATPNAATVSAGSQHASQSADRTMAEGIGRSSLAESGKGDGSSYSAMPRVAGTVSSGTYRANTQDVFSEARNSVGIAFVGQTAYLDDLCIAFKRPFETGDRKSPKNTVLVIGGRASGRHKSIRIFAEELARKGVLQDGSLVTMDLSRYPTPQDDKLFLSDLYSALSSHAQVLAFDNYQDAHSSVIKVLTDLFASGKYRLEARYIQQQDVLMDSSGALAKDTIDEIHAEDKFLFLVTDKSESDVADVFGRRLMESLGDIVCMGDYSVQEVREYCAKTINKAVADIEAKLGMHINPDSTVLDYLVSMYSKKDGFRDPIDFLEVKLYKTLSNYKLANPEGLPFGTPLGIIGDTIILTVNGKTVDLGEYMPREYKGNIDEVKAELDEVIGLDEVKHYVLGIERNLDAQRMRKEAGRKTSPVSMHMIFTGNPGTGKTTIARIVAKYLKALGVISSGHLREVSRSDLVGQYVGHTATQTRSVIESAVGGVLFIDEAYSLCRGDNDNFGLEAIDTLVKGMEDNRDDLVVILAGYTDEMGEFLNSNPGLRSRFPNTIEFPDYSPQEMLSIAKSIASSRGYTIAGSCEEPLLRQFERSQVKGRNDSGNGRLVRNVVETAIVRQSQRILDQSGADIDELVPEDFAFDDAEEFDLEAELSAIIGLESVKEFIRAQRKLLIANQKRRDAGLATDTSQNLNMLFLGNPGTGKTTVARIMANMLKEMKYLKSGQLVEVGRSDLVSQYAGGTARKTEEVFRKALGGVLFVDEAYSLSQNGDSFGQEAIDTLVKLIEDFREDTVVILAGYQREMTQFLKSNSGLESRFPIKVEFPGYSQGELVAIAEKMFTAKGFTLTDVARGELPERLASFKRGEAGTSGNGRMVRNYVENVLRNQSARVAAYDATRDELVEVLPEDLAIEAASEGFDLEAELSQVIGLDGVKQYMRSLQARLRLVSERRRLGLPVDETQTLHMVFTGNPGTGKTTMARLIAKTLFNIGVVSSDKVVETDRAGLVAGYVGQTAIKTADVIKRAMGGILFIDEAYALSSGGENDFGKEAIDTLVKLVDDNRDSIVVILAGYTKDMNDFLASNPGLKSRFPNVIEFTDYNTEELLEIADLFYGKNGYILTDSARQRLAEVFDSARKQESFGNGRYVRNVYERSLNNQAMRLSGDFNLTREELTTIEAADIEEVR